LLIGRERELDEIEILLLDERTRLLSIVAPGGMGKTRLALEVASRLVDRFTDGVAFVSLAPLPSTESIVPSLAQALQFRPEGGEGAAPRH